VWTVGVVDLVLLACVLKATTRKWLTLSGKKSAPQIKSWLRLMEKNTLQNKFLVTAQAATIDNLLKKSRLM